VDRASTIPERGFCSHSLRTLAGVLAYPRMFLFRRPFRRRHVNAAIDVYILFRARLLVQTRSSVSDALVIWRSYSEPVEVALSVQGRSQ